MEGKLIFLIPGTKDLDRDAKIWMVPIERIDTMLQVPKRHPDPKLCYFGRVGITTFLP